MDRTRKVVRRRKGRAYRLISFIIIVAVILFAIGFFFRIEEITVEGSTRYTDMQIIEASGIETGKSLYGLNKFTAIDRIKQNFSYIEEVTIRRRIPDTIVVTVTERKPVAVISTGGTYWLIDSGAKLLEPKRQAEGYIEIVGLTLVSPEAASDAAVSDEDGLKLKQVKTLLPALAEYGLIDRTTGIDVSLVSNTSFRFEDRLTVKIGDTSDINYKMKFFSSILDELDGSDAGTIVFTDEKTARFISD